MNNTQHPTFNCYTVESVSDGHPDKVCDQISDAILDACLSQDPTSRVAVEAFGSHGLLVLGGEVTTRADTDFEKIARSVYRDIGYTDTLRVSTNIAQQSGDIAQGVDTGGAGDQGIMYGFACDETSEYLPQGIVLAHAVLKKLRTFRKEHPFILGPDAKSQVTFVDGRVETVVLSSQHHAAVAHEDLVSLLKQSVVQPVFGDIEALRVLINQTGSFIQGGFAADAGLTGRKIMVDTYGGLIPHGGGAFSGKDATKVDRSAAYMARFVAKNLVAHGYGTRCLVSVAYAIGVQEPVMLTAHNEQGVDLSAVVKQHFDFRPQVIIERLNLRQPIYQQTASFGHFGNSVFPWEQIVPLS